MEDLFEGITLPGEQPSTIEFIEIPETFAKDRDNRLKHNNNVFTYAKTLDGRYMCSPNCMTDFPITFGRLKLTGWMPVIEVLDMNAFVNDNDIQD